MWIHRAQVGSYVITFVAWREILYRFILVLSIQPTSANLLQFTATRQLFCLFHLRSGVFLYLIVYLIV